MNVRFVMPRSLSPLRIALFLLVALVHMSCESKQEDAPKPAATASAEPGILELPEGSTTLPIFKRIERLSVRSGRSSRPRRERFWPTRID